MKKQDLQSGMVVELRNKDRYLVLNNRLLNSNGETYINLADFSDDDYDIIAVYKPITTLNEISLTSNVLWKRELEHHVYPFEYEENGYFIPMTLEELSKKLGMNIRLKEQQ